MTRRIHVHGVQIHPTNHAVLYRPPDPTVRDFVAQGPAVLLYNQLVLAHRGFLYGLDPESPDFHALVLEHLLHEGHSNAAGPPGTPVRSLHAAREDHIVTFTPGVLETIREDMPMSHDHLQRVRTLLGDRTPLG